MSKIDQMVAVLDDMDRPSTRRKHGFDESLVGYVANMREIAVQSIKFVIDGGSLLEKATEFFVLPPYEQCCIQTNFTDGQVVIFLVRQISKDEFLSDVMTEVENYLGLIIPAGYQLRIARLPDGRPGYSAREVVRGDELGINNLKEHEEATAWCLCAALGVMACSNVSYVDSPKVSAKLNKKRAKAGKRPLFEYKTLHINTCDSTVDKAWKGGTHASPRVHLRRGHIRRLPSGATIWVQPCVVGDRAAGVVHKDYAVIYRKPAAPSAFRPERV